MIKLKKELMEANEITKELDKSLVSLMKKYEDEKIKGKDFYKAFNKHKDKIAKAEFFTDDGVELYYTLEIFFDYLDDENIKEVEDYNTCRDWIIEELLGSVGYYKNNFPALDEKICNYRWPSHKDKMRVENTINFYTALLKNDFNLLKEVNCHYWEDIISIINDIDFSTFNKNTKFDQEVIKLSVEAIDYGLHDREDPFDPYGGSYKKSYAMYNLVEKLRDLEVDIDYIIETIDNVCYESFDEILEKIGKKEFLKERLRGDIKNNINVEEKIKEIVSDYPEVSFKFLSGSFGLDDQTPAELYLKKGNVKLVLKGHGPFGSPGIDKEELEEALKKLKKL
jgi:hypothetical protein